MEDFEQRMTLFDLHYKRPILVTVWGKRAQGRQKWKQRCQLERYYSTQVANDGGLN